jgi:hypothetical protein
VHDAAGPEKDVKKPLVLIAGKADPWSASSLRTCRSNRINVGGG